MKIYNAYFNKTHRMFLLQFLHILCSIWKENFHFYDFFITKSKIGISYF